MNRESFLNRQKWTKMIVIVEKKDWGLSWSPLDDFMSGSFTIEFWQTQLKEQRAMVKFDNVIWPGWEKAQKANLYKKE